MIEKNEIRKVRLGHLQSEKFASMAHTKQPHLKYNGGPLLGNVEVFTIFWGSAWQMQPALASLSQTMLRVKRLATENWSAARPWARGRGR